MSPRPGLTLRRAGTQDASQVKDLVRLAYAKWVKIIGREPMPMTVDYERAVQVNDIALLFDDDRLVALIETVPNTDPLLIENIAVHPEYQGFGYGRYLLADAEATAREAGFGSVTLYTNQVFTQNVEFYLEYGFNIDRLEKHANGATAVHFIKPL